MESFKLWDGPSADTNFGKLRGGLLQIVIPDVGDELTIVGYASDAVVSASAASDSALAGLAGLPLLRQFRYGGDDEQFWIDR